MSDRKKHSQESASAISAAIRAKHERTLATESDLAALEASLLADLDAFGDRSLDPAHESASQRVVLPKKNEFPSIIPEGAHLPKSATAASGLKAAHPPVKPMTSGLLSQLRQQAETLIQETTCRTKAQERDVLRMDECLRQLFDYVNDLVQQLNVIRPTISRTYTLFGSIRFSDLAWQRGFADYRTYRERAGVAIESVMMSFNLKATRELQIERDAAAIESLRKMLYDSGVVFRCEETLNQRRMVEKATFFLAPEIRATLRWVADPVNGVIVLETRNFERFGDQRYFQAPESFDPAMFEEFGRLLLGQPNRFRDFVRR